MQLASLQTPYLHLPVDDLLWIDVSSSLDSHMMIYGSLVRSKLACASAVCNSLTNTDSNKLEIFRKVYYVMPQHILHRQTCNYTL